MHTVAQYSLPYMAADRTMTLSGSIDIANPDAAPQIEGTGVQVKLLHDSKYSSEISARDGDRVRVLIRLHNGSCSPSTVSNPVTVRTSSHADAARGFLRVSAVAKGPMLEPPSTTFGPATINLEGESSASLSLLPGTTKLYGATCDEPQPLETLGDWIFQSGVTVDVPGYLPRMTCASHSRYVTTDLVVTSR